LVAHAYVIDESIGQVRLIRSASLFREFDKRFQQAAGRANRFLHYKDMLCFRSAGIQWYDLGGINLEAENVSPELRQVSDYKRSFGGRVIQEANYLSLLLYVYRRWRQLSSTRQRSFLSAMQNSAFKATGGKLKI
jgi:lipid II:glycine glycyltransferase (peptidoglycan interpeptide bridge formation enzyme)